VQHIRRLRQCGWGVGALAEFFGLTPPLVALATSYVNIAASPLQPMPAFTDNAYDNHRPEPAAFVHFGRAYSDPAEIP
jgi:hypothetical protein